MLLYRTLNNIEFNYVSPFLLFGQLPEIPSKCKNDESFYFPFKAEECLEHDQYGEEMLTNARKELQSYVSYANKKEHEYSTLDCLEVPPELHITKGSSLTVPSRFISTTRDFSVIKKYLDKFQLSIPANLIYPEIIQFLPVDSNNNVTSVGKVVVFSQANDHVIYGSDLQFHPNQPYIADFRKEVLFVDRIPASDIVAYGLFIKINYSLYSILENYKRENPRSITEYDCYYYNKKYYLVQMIYNTNISIDDGIQEILETLSYNEDPLPFVSHRKLYGAMEE